MIVYDLQCANGHTFEGWFEDRRAFEDQTRNKLITCPMCNETSVVPVLSKLSIKVGQTSSENECDKPEDLAMVEKAMEFLEKECEDVGANFAPEALKMHYDVTEKRSIRGTTTAAEEEVLKQEGIEFFKVPIPRLDS
ncbi:MAG: hypothetical protein BA872_01245 [Desulfobacterales bacterium C00003060]|nr:MAG: hypothetical protein BA872_01245 [Desulfobacterales bacterium C00003060]